MPPGDRDWMEDGMSETQTPTYYDLLSLHPSASPQEIRRAYRELSKRYHPDTTTLPTAVATDKFQQLNEAYATLSSPQRRFAYDLKIGYSRTTVIQPRLDLNRPVSESRKQRSTAYLDPTDRPLSPGELFALMMIAVAFLLCVGLVVFLGFTGGKSAFQPLKTPGSKNLAVYTAASEPQQVAQTAIDLAPSLRTEFPCLQ